MVLLKNLANFHRLKNYNKYTNNIYYIESNITIQTS